MHISWQHLQTLAVFLYQPIPDDDPYLDCADAIVVVVVVVVAHDDDHSYAPMG